MKMVQVPRRTCQSLNMARPPNAYEKALLRTPSPAVARHDPNAAGDTHLKRMKNSIPTNY
jgi:hypothetical protein